MMCKCEQIDLRCCKRCLKNFLQLQISQRSLVKERIHQRLIHSYVDYPRNKDSRSKRLTTKNVHSSLELERFRQGSAPPVLNFRNVWGGVITALSAGGRSVFGRDYLPIQTRAPGRCFGCFVPRES